uniref:NAD-dependent epimerase/dehydratase domain-containing protein n=1 Tax=Panagrolaimus sp. JU765 TaxID=591449 RepID=A0AC34R517_9BILA
MYVIENHPLVEVGPEPYNVQNLMLTNEDIDAYVDKVAKALNEPVDPRVINAHEFHDLSISPDKTKLNQVNFQFVQKMAELCQKLNVARIIQVSSIYLQCSTMWPNIHGREVEGTHKSGRVPFKPFVESKNRGEQVLKSLEDGFQVVIARIGELFGEGDVKSSVCDAIWLTGKLKFLPIFGDCQGIIQMSYARNIATSIVQIASSLSTRPEIKFEIVCLRDETPNKDIYSTCLIPFVANKGHPLAQRQIPFFLIFPLLCLAMLLSKFLNILGIASPLDKLPDLAYFYLLFRHWIFLDDFKQKIFFGIAYNPVKKLVGMDSSVEKKKSEVILNFQVETTLKALVYGLNDQNIQSAWEIDGIKDIRVIEDDEDSAEFIKIKIKADTEEAAEKARKQLYYLTDSVKVPLKVLEKICGLMPEIVQKSSI